MIRINYYDVLGVEKNASCAEIKSAYRRLAKKYHPDANQDGTSSTAKKFQMIHEAYEVLCNTDRRIEYDNKQSSKTENRNKQHYPQTQKQATWSSTNNSKAADVRGDMQSEYKKEGKNDTEYLKTCAIVVFCCGVLLSFVSSTYAILLINVGILLGFLWIVKIILCD